MPEDKNEMGKWQLTNTKMIGIQLEINEWNGIEDVGKAKVPFNAESVHKSLEKMN